VRDTVDALRESERSLSLVAVDEIERGRRPIAGSGACFSGERVMAAEMIENVVEPGSMEDIFGPVIHSYSRAEALADGFLVDMTEWASAETGFMGGFTVPVALTSALWATIEAIPKSHWGDVRGRAHDVLWMGSLAARGLGKRNVLEGNFEVILPSKGTRKRKRLLRIVSGPGDNGEHVITIGFPEDF
jgi:hypothetical protein